MSKLRKEDGHFERREGLFSEQILKGEGRLPKGKGKRFSQNKKRKKERKR